MARLQGAGPRLDGGGVPGFKAAGPQLDGVVSGFGAACPGAMTAMRDDDGEFCSGATAGNAARVSGGGRLGASTGYNAEERTRSGGSGMGDGFVTPAPVLTTSGAGMRGGGRGGVGRSWDESGGAGGSTWRERNAFDG